MAVRAPARGQIVSDQMVVDRTGAFDDIKTLIVDKMPFGNDFSKLMIVSCLMRPSGARTAFGICSVALQGRISCQLWETSSMSISVSRCSLYVTD